MRLVIFGSRGVDPTGDEIEEALEEAGWRVDDIKVVVSGGARGADRAGEVWGKWRRLKVVTFPAEWDKYGKGAGHIRNKQMAEYATCGLAFWDGRSPGTANMLAWCAVNDVAVHVKVVDE